MKRLSLSTTRRLVVLLRQPSRDDSFEIHAKLSRYDGLAVIPVADPRDALMLAPTTSSVVTGINLDDPHRVRSGGVRNRHSANERKSCGRWRHVTARWASDKES